MKIIRCIGLRKCLEKQKVPIIVATPTMERAEEALPTTPKVWICSAVSDIVKFAPSSLEV